MTYPEVVNFLYNQLPVFQQDGQKAFKPGLERIAALCKYLDEPQQAFPIIHVAGTNGKGSTCHYLTSVLMEAGYKVGLHTSPHIKDLRERFTINGQWVAESFVIDFVERIKGRLNDFQPTFFELTVAMAFDLFQRQKVDIAVIETGMGGRLDSTNIVDPILSIITKIGLDHTQYLGETLEQIAGEKSGIIKKHRPVVIGRNSSAAVKVLLSKASDLHAPAKMSDDVVLEGLNTMSLPPYQHENLACVVTAIGVLREAGWRIKGNHIQDGIDNCQVNTGFGGRWQRIGNAIFDTGHNVDALERLAENLAMESYAHLHVVWGMVADKDHEPVLALLPKDATYYFCAPDLPRALDVATLAQKAENQGLKGTPFQSCAGAMDAALKAAKPSDLILVGGSTFVVAELLPAKG